MLVSAGADPRPLCSHNQPQASDDRLPCLENPRPAGAEPSLTENVTSPFQAEPAHFVADDTLEQLSTTSQVGQTRLGGSIPTGPACERRWRQCPSWPLFSRLLPFPI